MLEKYCEVIYRDYKLEVERDEYVLGKFSFKGSSRGKIIFLAFPYTLEQVINKFISAVDEHLKEPEVSESRKHLNRLIEMTEEAGLYEYF